MDVPQAESHTDGMNTGTEKIAVSLPKGLADRARRAVRQGRAASVSAYVAAALEEKVKLASDFLENIWSVVGGHSDEASLSADGSDAVA